MGYPVKYKGKTTWMGLRPHNVVMADIARKKKKNKDYSSTSLKYW